MTDFIHEQPEEKLPDAVRQPEQEEEKLDERTGQKRVYGYIFVLFVVAFCLLLWSFFMNQRSTDQVLSELRGNTGALQSTLDRNAELEQRIGRLEDENELLRQQVEELEKNRIRTEAEISRLTDENGGLLRDLAAYGCACELEYAFGKEDYERCRALIDQKLWRYYQEKRVYTLTEDSEANRPWTRARFEEILDTIGYERPTGG
jgi:cell division protein FtsB